MSREAVSISVSREKSPVPKKRRAAVPGKRRVPHLKVKTGCLTCKVRRVKCDEGKPSCQACIKFRMPCDGYSHLTIKNPEIALRARSLRPRGSEEFPSTGSPNSFVESPPERTPTPLLLPSQLLSEDMDALYLEAFKNDVIPGMSRANSVIRNGGWSYIVLQTSYSEPWIMDAIVAIAALRVSVKTSTQILRDGKSAQRGCHHYDTALKRYDRAIKSMRMCFPSDNGSPSKIRNIVIACLLVFCFEGNHGREKLGLLQVASAHEYLQNLLSNQPEIDVKDGALMIGQHTFVEADLLDAFFRLHVQAASSIHDTQMCGEDAYGDCVLEEISDPCERTEALRNLIVVHRRIATFAMSCSSTNITSEQNSGSDNIGRIYDSENRSLIDCYATIHTPYPVSPVLPQFLANYDRLSAEILRVSKSQLDNLEDSNDVPATLFLRIYERVIRVNLDATILMAECGWDDYHETFKAIIDDVSRLFELGGSLNPGVVRRVVNYSPIESLPSPFSMDMGVIAILYAVGRYCRNHSLRAQAISLLKHTPRREGIWDSIITRRLVEWQTSKEEAGTDCIGYIPEECRVRILRVNVENQSAENSRRGWRSMGIVYGMRYANGQVHIAEDDVKWHVSEDCIHNGQGCPKGETAELWRKSLIGELVAGSTGWNICCCVSGAFEDGTDKRPRSW